MAFIENTYIDNVNNPEVSSNDAIYGLIGTALGIILGFLLTYFSDKKKIKKEILRIKDNFFRQMLQLKATGIQQAKELAKHKLLVKGYITAGLHLNMFKPYDFVRSLDSLTLNEALNLEFKEGATERLNTFYNCINIIEETIYRIERNQIEYEKETQLFADTYTDLLQELNRKVREYTYQVSEAIFNNDKLFLFMHNLLEKDISNLVMSPQNIVPLKDSIHQKIKNSGLNTNVNHYLYRAVLDFNYNGITLIKKFQVTTNRYLSNFEALEISFVNSHNSIFNDALKNKKEKKNS